MAGAFPSGAALEVFATLDSTSAEARRRVAAGARGPLWILALEQTAGYGRRGSAWTQSAGDFAGTFLFDAAAPPENLGQLAFVAGLAVAEAVESFAPRAPLSLKWPNDVLLDGRKLAGVLLELVAPPAIVALGVGVNIVSKPAAADYPTARLIGAMEGSTHGSMEGGAPPSPEAFAARLDAAFARWRAIWRADGFAPVRAAWLEKAARLGETVTARLPGETVTGVFADLDQSGALVLECENGRRAITAGAILSAHGR